MCGHPPQLPAEVGGTQGTRQLLEVGVGTQEAASGESGGSGQCGDAAQVMGREPSRLGRYQSLQ